VYIDDEYYKTQKDRDYDKVEMISYSTLANFISQCATLALSLQVTSLYQFKITHLYPQRESKQIPQMFASTIALSSIFFELGKRGIMVQRELLEIDEIDMGWLINEANKTVSEWHKGSPNMIGTSIIFAPILVSAGYELSERGNYNSIMDVERLKEILKEIIENTTPEDTVNFIQMLYTISDLGRPYSVQINVTVEDTIEDVLDSETTLLDYFKGNSEQNLIFNEIANNYELIFSIGWPSFLEAWNETENYSIAINHTYFTLMGSVLDTNILIENDYKIANHVHKMAKEIIQSGGFMTKVGMKLALELDDYLFSNNIIPKSISLLTSVVTFLALFNGFRP
jgi:triphosphoribosyl-dephospho-CoA synthetase